MFQIECPNCGLRNQSEFRFGGEITARPADLTDDKAWYDYLYARTNELGVQTEWWYHSSGCQRWFLARRHTMSNEVLETFWFEDRETQSEQS